MLYPSTYYTNTVMSTNQQQNQRQNLEQLQSLHGVGNKTVQRLEESESYNSISDVQEADPIALKKTIELNYADALWIQTQLENSENSKSSNNSKNSKGDSR